MGRVLEQGLMEVMEEEELAAMREHQQQLQAIRDAGAGLSGAAGCAQRDVQRDVPTCCCQ